jgi:alkanesulfonate monooxygenase SsuD/methylene tetrahydromethanopterin reductase-like flavin-dependent oxidoreductase (luciferase family)
MLCGAVQLLPIAVIAGPFDPPASRKGRLAKSVEILRRLLDRERLDHQGEH